MTVFCTLRIWDCLFWQLANSIMRGIYITVFGGTISADQMNNVFDKST